MLNDVVSINNPSALTVLPKLLLLNDVTDNLSKLLIGYSFLNYKANKLQPAYAPKLISICIKNSPYSSPYNVFMRSRLVSIFTVYYKGYRLTKEYKPIYYFLPPRLSCLLAWTQLFTAAYLTDSCNNPIDTQASYSTLVALNYYTKEFLNGATATPIYYAYRHAAAATNNLDPYSDDDALAETLAACNHQALRLENLSVEISNDLVRTVAGTAAPKLRDYQRANAFIQLLNNAFKINCIVVNKAHLILGANNDFRFLLLQLGQRTAFACLHRLFLTATLPPCRRLPIYFCNVNIADVADVKPAIFTLVNCFRAANKAYATAKYKYARLAIVYCCSLQDVSIWGWLKRSHVIVATTSLGVSMDHPNVSLILYYSLPYNLISWMQQAGCSACNGLPAYAVIIYTGNPRHVDRQYALKGTWSTTAVNVLLSNTLYAYIGLIYNCKQYAYCAVVAGLQAGCNYYLSYCLTAA
ncbi:hypothetical protein EsH8_XV_000045 [Colletotrichum jinshuiense]